MMYAVLLCFPAPLFITKTHPPSIIHPSDFFGTKELRCHEYFKVKRCEMVIAMVVMGMVTVMGDGGWEIGNGDSRQDADGDT